MVAVDVESLLESLGRGGGGGTVSGDDAQSSSPISVSLSYLERSDQAADAQPVSLVNNSEEGSGPQSPEFGDDRFLFGIPMHLLKGRIPINVVPLVPVDDLPVIQGYNWAPHNVGL